MDPAVIDSDQDPAPRPAFSGIRAASSVGAAVALLTLVVAACHRPSDPTVNAPIRVAVIGGMTATGLWDHLATRFERATGLRCEVVATGPKEILAPAFRDGRVDVLTMHSSDEATDLVAGGFARHLRPWARNELVILGPPSDPAAVRHLTDGAEALRRIAASGQRFVDARGGGRRLVFERLLARSGLPAGGDWILRDESDGGTDLLRFAESRGAYALCGRIPVLTGKIPRGGMEILVDGDPDMRRPYVVIEADPARFPAANVTGARRLTDFLTGPDGQAALRDFAATASPDRPLFLPLGP